MEDKGNLAGNGNKTENHKTFLRKILEFYFTVNAVDDILYRYYEDLYAKVFLTAGRDGWT